MFFKLKKRKCNKSRSDKCTVFDKLVVIHKTVYVAINVMYLIGHYRTLLPKAQNVVPNCSLNLRTEYKVRYCNYIGKATRSVMEIWAA